MLSRANLGNLDMLSSCFLESYGSLLVFTGYTDRIDQGHGFVKSVLGKV